MCEIEESEQNRTRDEQGTVETMRRGSCLGMGVMIKAGFIRKVPFKLNLKNNSPGNLVENGILKLKIHHV